MVLAVLQVGAVNVRSHIPGTRCVADTREPTAWANVEERGVQGNGRVGVSGGQGGAMSVDRKVGAMLGRSCIRGLDFYILPRSAREAFAVFLILKTGSHQTGYVLCPPPPPSLRARTTSILSPLYPQGPARLFLALVDTRGPFVE